MPPAELTDVSTHFRFGQNWEQFAQKLSPSRIAIAEACLSRLFDGRLDGRSFLDIGSGSGLSALAAIHLGASPVVASDIDEDSVRTTQATLSHYASGSQFAVHRASVFDLPQDQYDVVHSWGVLHHTGDMWRAIRTSALRVKPNGIYAIAIYLKTPFCGLWKQEKRVYTALPPAGQRLVLSAYRALVRLALRLRGRSPDEVWKSYESGRGMDQDHDLHDWLGGYPYESASAEEITSFMRRMGFSLVRSFDTGPRMGVLGTGCAEYVFQRMQQVS